MRCSKKKENAHDDAIWSVAWSKSNLILTASVDESAKVWDPEKLDNPVVLGSGTHDLAVLSVVSNSEGTVGATSSMDGMIRTFDLKTGKMLKSINAGQMETWTIAYHPKSDILISGTHTGKINVWDMKSGEKQSTMDSEGKFTMSVTYSPDGSRVACGSFDGNVQVFDVESGKAILKLTGHHKAVRSLTFS